MTDNINTHLFTSESVSEGHPDKICDQVSDAVLDAILDKDPMARVACECYATTGLIIVGGEITTDSYIDLPKLVREVITDIGYTKDALRFDANSCAIINVINQQSADIALGVNTGGAGDQGMMFGYACNETEELMPAPIMFAHALVERLADVRKKSNHLMTYLRPDAKSQVTLKYSDTGEILGVDTIVISTQHDPGISIDVIREDVIEHIIKPIIPNALLNSETKNLCQPNR